MSDLTVQHRDHAAHRATLEAFFKSHPREAIEAETLIALVGTNYHQRMSELRTGKFSAPMRFQNLVRYHVVNGVKHRGAGAYVFLDFDPLGRDSTVPTTPHGNRLLFDPHARG